MVQWIFIDKFRSLSNLCIDPLGLVTVFVGKNGTGKTSVLEAASLAFTGGSASQLSRLAYWREFPQPKLEAPDAIRAFFPEMNLSRRPTIRFMEDDLEGVIDLEPLAEAPSGMSFSYPPRETLQSDAEQFYGVNLYYKAPGRQSPVVSRLLLRENGVEETQMSIDLPESPNLRSQAGKPRLASPKVSMRRTGCFYVSPRRSTSVVN